MGSRKAIRGAERVAGQLSLSCYARAQAGFAFMLDQVAVPGYAGAMAEEQSREEAAGGGKHALLLAAYGAGGALGSHSLRLFEEQARRIFPDAAIRWAFTSLLMRGRLASASRKKADSVRKALCRLAFEKYERVTVQPLYLIPGLAYEMLLAEVTEVMADGAPGRISIGLPLLGGPEDIKEAARAMLRHAPPERKSEEALIWVGHGAGPGRDNDAYAGLDLAAQALDPRLFAGALSGGQGLEQILPRLRALGIASAWVMPLLSVVGKHAAEDIAGEQENSWRCRLRAEGIACRCVLRGTLEYEGFAAVWLSHLRKAAEA